MNIKHQNRRDFMKAAGLGLASVSLAQMGYASKSPAKKPNFIVIFLDDVGYADFGCYGHPTINTPNVDKLAQEGQKWTNYYVASSVCTPSRAGLLTGRLPVRSGMAGTKARVMMPWSDGGLPQSEETIATSLKKVGYKTACIGKWHLGHAKKEYMPNAHGFDYFYGIPLNIDHYGENGWTWKKYETLKTEMFKKEYYEAPLIVNGEVKEKATDPTTVTKRYVEQTNQFIKQNKDKPFFVYLAHSMAHVPLFTSEKFKKKSLRGLYGDVMEEIDWGVGEIVETLKEQGLDDNTMIVFTSDNGPWLMWEQYGGTAGMLKGGKADLWEGGFRVPCIFWWPGKIKPKIVRGLGNTLDFLPTFCHLAGAPLPKKKLDGVNLTPALLEGKKSPNNLIYYYRFSSLYAIRKGSYKAYFYEYTGPQPWQNNTEYIVKLEKPWLFNVDHDPSERVDIADQHPEIIADIWQDFQAHVKTVEPVENQVDKRNDEIYQARRPYYK